MSFQRFNLNPKWRHKESPIISRVDFKACNITQKLFLFFVFVVPTTFYKHYVRKMDIEITYCTLILGKRRKQQRDSGCVTCDKRPTFLQVIISFERTSPFIFINVKMNCYGFCIFDIITIKNLLFLANSINLFVWWVAFVIRIRKSKFLTHI